MDHVAETTQMAQDDIQILEVAEDEQKTVLMRVRQKATRADAINGNNRLYPRKVVEEAIAEARPRAQVGVMLSDYIHPRVAVIDGEEVYEDRPTAKSARVDDISDVGPDGWVYVTRSILNTPEGRKVANRIKQGDPPGISTRFQMKGHTAVIQGRRTHVADVMKISTWDDVEKPAFPEAGKQFVVLSDELVQEAVNQRTPPVSLEFKACDFATPVEGETSESPAFVPPPNPHWEPMPGHMAPRQTMTEEIQRSDPHFVPLGFLPPLAEVFPTEVGIAPFWGESPAESYYSPRMRPISRRPGGD